MAEPLVEHDTGITISCIEEELRQLTDLQLSSSSESDMESEDENNQRQLQEFAELSQKLVDEFTVLEAEYETELTCGERAEDHPTQVPEEKKENLIDTQIITPPLCEHREDFQPTVTGGPCTTEVDQRLTEDLKKNIQKLSEEKEQIASELQELRTQTKRLNKELEDERLEKEAIGVKLEKHQNKFLKLNRVSLAVTREYADTLDKLELEQSLRYEAESYASKVLKEKKAISRQSMILMQNLQPKEMLMKALDDVRSLTTTLEDTKQELQTQVMTLELQLSERPTQEQLLTMQEALTAVIKEKSHLQEELKVTKEKCTGLEERVKSLEEELQRQGLSGNSTDEASVIEPAVSPVPPPVPPPPPPPPPPCPPSKATEDPLAFIKQRRGLRESEESPVIGGPNTSADAVREMMERIKRGVILRPARNDRKQDQAAVTGKRKSVISELHGILLDTVRKPARKASRRRMSRKAKDSELDSVLQRRRQIVDNPKKAGSIRKTLKHFENLEKNNPQLPFVTPLDNEDKLSSNKQIQKSFKKQPETGQVSWQ